MFDFIATKLLGPLIADLVVRLVERYVKDAIFKNQIDDAIKLAKSAQSEEETKEAAKAIHDAINITP